MNELIIEPPPNIKFIDIDAIFTWKNFLFTLLFSLLAFLSNWYPSLMLPFDNTLGFEIPPYRLSLMLLFVALGAAVTANLSSALVIGLVAGVSFHNYADPNASVANASILVLLTITVSLTSAWLSIEKIRGKIQGYMLLVLSILLSIPPLFASWRMESEVDKYYQVNINIAHGTSFGLFTSGITLTDVLTLFFLILFWVLWYFLYLKNDVNLAGDESNKYNLAGLALLAVGALLPLGTVSFLTRTFKFDTLHQLGNGVNAGEVLRDLFLHQKTPTFVVTETISIFYIYLISLNLILFGVFLRLYARAEGNRNHVNYGSLSTYISYPIGYTVIYLYGFQSIANILGTSSSYVLPVIAYPIYFTLTTMTIAFLVLFTLIIEVIWASIQNKE